MDKAQIKKIVNDQITSQNELGTKAGSSGHLGHTSYRLDVVEDPVDAEFEGRKVIKVRYQYTLVTETEFTYYPDNPPYESSYAFEILIDETGKIVKQESIELLNPDVAGELPFDPKDLQAD